MSISFFSHKYKKEKKTVPIRYLRSWDGCITFFDIYFECNSTAIGPLNTDDEILVEETICSKCGHVKSRKIIDH